MSWPFSKYAICPLDGGTGILLVDAETESIPSTDEDGNPLYYCLEGEHPFSVKAKDDWGERNTERRYATAPSVRFCQGAAYAVARLL